MSVAGQSSAPSAAVTGQMIALVPRLRRFCAALTRSVDAGDDLAQATIERALRRIGQWQEGTKLDSWMFTIARNIYVDQCRAEGRRGVQVAFDQLDSAPGEDGREITERRSELAQARSAILALPEDQRMLVDLVIVDGRSYQEAADVLDIPIGTVMSRLSRARRAVADRMSQSMEGLLS